MYRKLTTDRRTDGQIENYIMDVRLGMDLWSDDADAGGFARAAMYQLRQVFVANCIKEICLSVGPSINSLSS